LQEVKKYNIEYEDLDVFVQNDSKIERNIAYFCRTSVNETYIYDKITYLSVDSEVVTSIFKIYKL